MLKMPNLDREQSIWIQMRGCGCLPPDGWFDTQNVQFVEAGDVNPAEMGETDRLILIYRMAVPYLCKAMSNGVPPSEALADWKQAAETIAVLSRKLRGRAVLIDGGAVDAHPSVVAQALGIEDEDPQPSPEDEAGLKDQLFALIAEKLIDHAPAVRKLSAELEALALPIEVRPALSRFDADRIFRHLTGVSQSSKDLKDQVALQAKLVASSETLSTMTAERDALIAQKQSLEDKSQSLSEARQGLQAENAQLRQDLAEIRDERDRLLSESLVLQSEMEAGFVAANGTSLQLEDELRQIRNLHDQIRDLEQEYDRVLSSKSWRLTEPLRWARRVVSFER